MSRREERKRRRRVTGGGQVTLTKAPITISLGVEDGRIYVLAFAITQRARFKGKALGRIHAVRTMSRRSSQRLFRDLAQITGYELPPTRGRAADDYGYCAASIQPYRGKREVVVSIGIAGRQDGAVTCGNTSAIISPTLADKLVKALAGPLGWVLYEKEV